MELIKEIIKAIEHKIGETILYVKVKTNELNFFMKPIEKIEFKMSNAEKYLRDKIPTMVGERHVSSMDLSTMISLLNGFHASELKQVVISETECKHEYRTFVDRVDKTSDCWCIKCLKKI